MLYFFLIYDGLINMNSCHRSELVFGYKKCSWLVVQALEHADEDQKKIVFVSTFNLANFQNKEDSA